MFRFQLNWKIKYCSPPPSPSLIRHVKWTWSYYKYIYIIQCIPRNVYRPTNDNIFSPSLLLYIYRYGDSKRNQRIEAWWSCFKKSRSSWWINLFKDLMDSGKFESGNILHKECIWFCFCDILQKDLNYTKTLWNNHYIRSSKHETVPG